jgi:uncharacterized protein YdeI (BOF family)
VRKIFLHFSFFRLSVAAITLFVIALGTPSYSQQADQDPAPASRQQQPEATSPQQQPNEAQIPPSSDAMTHEATAFIGRITKENDELVLKDPVSKVSYKLDDQAKAKHYAGQQVKVNGKLDMDSNTIRVDSIEPRS